MVMYFFFFFFFSSRRRHTRCREVSWARRCVQETDRMQITFFEKKLLNFGLDSFAEKVAIRQNNSTTAAIFKQFLHDKRQEHIRRFTCTHIIREIISYAVFLHSAKRRISNYTRNHICL
eukprot:TRINITY_DN19672_c0_g1_i1.p3 TRINITY_DN19672_c0_g1~~TRINITY_DN19672_c0_g1_i1.p3  ORF type:complete len:119 (+),score=39.00 TRINITY_DN19672_c0_g1_i1:1-357(+)